MTRLHLRAMSPKLLSVMTKLPSSRIALPLLTRILPQLLTMLTTGARR
jgi:hypothetical protein